MLSETSRFALPPDFVQGSVAWTQLQPGAFEIGRNAIDLGAVRVARRTYNVACRGEGAVALGTAVYGILDDARSEARWMGVRAGVDDIAASSAAIDVCTSGPAVFLTVSVDADTGDRDTIRGSKLVRNRFGVGRLRWHLRHLLAAGATARSVWATSDAIVRLLRDALDANGTSIEHSQAQNRRVRAVRVCQEYMGDHLGSTVTLLDLSTVSGLGVRSLFNAFEAVTGLSPMAYLRAQRLGRVRETLQHGRGKRIRIIDVAADWGFWHMGHFAASYAAMFGETPSQTLAKTLRD